MKIIMVIAGVAGAIIYSEIKSRRRMKKMQALLKEAEDIIAEAKDHLKVKQ